MSVGSGGDVQPLHVAVVQMINRADDLDLAGVEFVPDAPAAFQHVGDGLPDVCADRAVDDLGLARAVGGCFRGGGTDVVDECGQHALKAGVLDGGRDRAASGVPHHDEHGGVQMIDAVFHRADLGRVGDVPRDADDEQVADTLIEDRLDRHA